MVDEDESVDLSFGLEGKVTMREIWGRTRGRSSATSLTRRPPQTPSVQSSLNSATWTCSSTAPEWWSWPRQKISRRRCGTPRSQ
jgi:hypothetical protein